MALLLETEKEKIVVLQVPKLSKPSIYHQVCIVTTKINRSYAFSLPLSLCLLLQSAVQISQPVLTEAMLKRHNQAEAHPPRPTFSGKKVTVNNR